MSRTSVPPLFRHQIESVTFFEARPRGFDASDPGTGKTRVQIELFAARRARGGGAALVLAPKSLLKSAWGNDFARYAPGLHVSIAYAHNREEAFAEDADVYVTNVDATKWLSTRPPSFFRRFDTLVIDEISYFKHRTAQRSRALNKIKKYFAYRYGLTGTPNSNAITDIWHPLSIIDDGQRLGTSFYHFRGSTQVPKQVGPQPNMLKWEDKPGSAEAVSALIKDITIRHEFERCTDIPPNFLYTVPFTMTPAHRKAYSEMEEHALVFLQEDTISAVNAAVVTNKLLQIASGAAYGESGDYALIDTGRYELIADLAEARKHTLIFFNWTHQRDELIKELEKRGLTYTVIDGSVSSQRREEAVDLFQKGFYRVFLAHPASAAHGLTLTRATTTIWASPTYNLEQFEQGNRRIYRLGQSQRTETIVVLGSDTIESDVYAILQEKSGRQGDLLGLLRRRLEVPGVSGVADRPRDGRGTRPVSS